jgi:hypothetical protein
VGTGFTKKNTDITEGKTDKMASAIGPFRDFVNGFEQAGYTQKQALDAMKNLSPG